MGRERYSNIEMSTFGFLVNILDGRRSGDGDTGSSFPRTDAEDISKGARFIPDEVTLARRAGKNVDFVTECSPNCWYWKMPDGIRIYHYDPTIYGGTRFEDGAGPCPYCGNVNTNGGTIKP